MSARTITTRLTTYYFLVMGVGVTAIIVSTFVVYSHDIRKSHDRSLKEYAEYLLEAERTGSDRSALIGSIRRQDSVSEAYYNTPWFFLSDDSGVIFSSHSRRVVPAIFDALQRKSARDLRGYQTVTIDGYSYRIYRRPTPVSGTYLTTIFSWDELEFASSSERMVLPIVLIVLLTGLGIGGGWLLTKRALRPIEEIRKLTHEITLYDLKKSVPVVSEDEIAQLGRSFNEMLVRLHEGIEAEHRFIAGTAHDIRTPLTVLRIELEANPVDELDPEARESFQRAMRQVKSLERLSSDLMMLANFGIGAIHAVIEIVSMNDLLLEIASDSFATSAQKHLSLRTDLIDEEIRCSVDPMLLRRAIGNLLDNAISYSPPGSVIQLCLERTDEKARIIIKDNGPGMSPEVLERATKHNFHNSGSVGIFGSGLGLVITKEILRIHGGEMLLASSAETGTSVTLLLPLLPADLLGLSGLDLSDPRSPPCHQAPNGA